MTYKERFKELEDIKKSKITEYETAMDCFLLDNPSNYTLDDILSIKDEVSETINDEIAFAKEFKSSGKKISDLWK